MKRRNSILTAAVACALCFSMLPEFPGHSPGAVLPVSADSYAYGCLVYGYLSDGTIEISDCSKDVTEMYIPEEIDGIQVTSIGECAFQDCTNLTEVSIPDSVTNIGDMAFDNTPWLRARQEEDPLVIVNHIVIEGQTCEGDIVLPDDVTSIGSLAFYECETLTGITLPAGVTSVGPWAFYGCINLTRVDLPEGLTTIGDSAFSDCANLTDLTVPNTVTEIGGRAFYNTPWLEQKRQENPLVILNGLLIDGQACTGAVVIPDGVTQIGNQAFYACSNLTEVTIPSSAESIGDSAFAYCYSLSDVTIPEGVTWIGDETFAYCDNLTSIAIPEGVANIGYETFCRCTNLRSISLPGSITSIGNYSFESCTNLTSIVIPEGVTAIGDSAFGGCSSLSSVAIPNTVTNIGGNAFRECGNLTSLVIPESVSSLGSFVFEYSGLTDISIPESVTSFGRYAFHGTPWLQAQQQEDPLVIVNNTVVDGTACWGDVVIPDTVNSIAGWAFYNCQSVTSVTIPDGVNKIGEELFYSCINLNSIAIPDSVLRIGNRAFNGCAALEDVYYGGDRTQWRDVTIGKENTELTTAKLHCNASGPGSETTAETEQPIIRPETVPGGGGAYETSNSTTTAATAAPSYGTILCGDVTLDGRVDITDAVTLNLAASGAVKLSEAALRNADCNSDGTTDTKDALILLKFLVKLINSLPVSGDAA